MRSIRYAVGLAALSAALFGGTAQADDPVPVCVDKEPAADFCLYVHTTPEPCVDGGGHVLNRRFIFFPCHLY